MARRVLHDEFFNKAKREGYRARSAYKLMEICESGRIIKKGDRVLDLGCSPGAWLQVASELVDERGIVIGIDLQETRPGLAPNVLPIIGDVYGDVPQMVKDACLQAGVTARVPPFDVVISDMAPDTTGHGDDIVSTRLCRRVLEILPGLLKPGGHMVVKIFEGGEYPQVLKEVRALFTTTKGFKPQASRGASREMYIIGTGRKKPEVRSPEEK